MIFKYSEFINESHIIQLLMENKIQFSKDFIQVLKSIKNKTSEDLLKLYNQDKPVAHNYIDVTDKEDFVSFIPDNKVSQIMGNVPVLYQIINTTGRLTNSQSNKHIYERLGFPIPEQIVKLDTGTDGKILGETVGTNGKIYVLFEQSESGEKTILNKNALRLVDDRENLLWTTNRNPIKIGRLLNSFLTAAGVSYTPSDIEKFVNEYKAVIKIRQDAFNHFSIVEGDDIINYYGSDVSADYGQLGNSCMRDAGDWLNIYAKNPEVVRMVILYDDKGYIEDGKYKSDMIVGRAILWKMGPKSSLPGEYFMDRIYTTNDSDIDLFKKFAEKMGWYCKGNQSSGNNFTAVLGSDRKSQPYIEVYLNIIPYNFPYVDTLYFLNMEDKKLSNSSVGADRALQSTGGDYENLEQDEDDEDYDS